jgi:UDP-glucose 4-epimerase
MKMVVLGASGFIGAAVASEIRTRGHSLETLSSAQDRLEITDAAACLSVFTRICPDVIINLAGRGATQNSASVEDIYAINVHGAANVARAVAGMPGPRPYLIHCGSSLEPLRGQVAESHYAASKAEGSARVREALEARGFANLRIANVYGPTMPAERLVMVLLTALRARKPIELQWPQRIRDFCYIDDVVRHIVDVAETPGTTIAEYTVGSGRSVSLLQLAEEVAAVTGAPRDCVRARPITEDDYRLCPDGFAASSLLECPTELRRGLELTLRRMP